jgi:hypothetical protein
MSNIKDFDFIKEVSKLKTRIPVYCSNCKWYNNIFYCWRHLIVSPDCDSCFHFTNIDIKSDYKEKYIKVITAAEILNLNNDCKNYKRKWYKFWVK